MYSDSRTAKFAVGAALASESRVGTYSDLRQTVALPNLSRCPFPEEAQCHQRIDVSFSRLLRPVAALASIKTPLFAGKTGVSAQAWVTAGDKRHQSLDVQSAQATATPDAGTLRADDAQQFQEILGFGAAFTDASCYLLNKLPADRRASLLSEFFSPSGLRFSVCRTCVGASDYATSAYSYDESKTPDPELKSFSIDHDRALHPAHFARGARRKSRTVPVRHAVESAWMDEGRRFPTGGSMRKRYFGPYADYFVRFLQEYQKENVKIEAVTVQNEVDTDQDGRMPAALWGQEYEIDFVKSHLAPALQRAGLKRKSGSSTTTTISGAAPWMNLAILMSMPLSTASRGTATMAIPRR